MEKTFQRKDAKGAKNAKGVFAKRTFAFFASSFAPFALRTFDFG
jgi:hypothetical protein